MAIDPSKYRSVLGHFPTGVTVVTGIVDGVPIGFTIGSFTSVSLDPPLVGFLPMTNSDRWAKIRSTGAFCVNVLGSTQDALCWQFSRSSIEQPFDGVSWTPSPISGSPIIEGAIAWMDCSIEQVVDAGDHHFVMGLITEYDHLHPDGDPQPLVFYRGTLGDFNHHA